MRTQSFPVCRPDRGIFPLDELVVRSARDFGPHVVMRAWTGEDHREISYAAFAKAVWSVARWLVDIGIRHGDRIAILGENRPEWGMAYLAIQCAGGVVVPVDRLQPASGIRTLLTHSESRLLFTSERYLATVADAQPLPKVERIVSFDENNTEGATPWSLALDAGSTSAAQLVPRSLSDLAAILYTSGTTGQSKGVMLTQRNIMSNVAGCSQLLPLGPGDTLLSMLPMHHSFEATAGFLFPFYCGCAITYARSIKTADLLADISATRVTAMASAPLLFEKMHEGIMRNVRKKGVVARILFSTLMGVVRGAELFGKPLGRRLFRGLRRKASLGSVHYFVTGAAPLDPATSRFFTRLGIPLLQGFGLTEASPLTHATPPGRIRHECVGLPLPGVECRIDDPGESGIGEVCIRGPNVFVGYYKNEEATVDAFDEDGWFHTGDLGKIHPDGYLQIMGRKKNVIVTAGGKNVYPEEVETLLNRRPCIMESLVMGIPRHTGYGEEVGALIYPDLEQVASHFVALGTPQTMEAIRALIAGEIREAGKDLPPYARIRRFQVLTDEFQKTTTRKVKRFLYSGDLLAPGTDGR
ncbi:long-chain fatty acid--CoA ligase [Candidatus Fermentibacteria bacterium]|nr:long-chain fatty acid--CoA ligase [Candidatus Fermentibacteria bacterium]